MLGPCESLISAYVAYSGFKARPFDEVIPRNEFCDIGAIITGFSACVYLLRALHYLREGSPPPTHLPIPDLPNPPSAPAPILPTPLSKSMLWPRLMCVCVVAARLMGLTHV